MGLTDPPATDPVTRFLAKWPKLLPAVMLALALLLLIPVGVYGRRAFLVPSAPSPSITEESPEIETLNLNKPEHITYTLGGIIGAILCAGFAAASLLGATVPSETDPVTRTRKSLLIAGGLLGGAVMIFGIGLLILWFGSIGKWLDGGDAKEAHRVLIPAVVVLFGAAIVFFTAIPARAEERNNQALRRFIYGSNLGLTTLLLLFALIAGNIFLALRVPNKLDTTESGFYTLTDDTVKYLQTLDQPVKAYTIMSGESDNRFIADARRLLDSCQEANPARFSVQELSAVRDKDMVPKLKARYPQYDFSSMPWILLTAGDDESRTAFITLQDLVKIERGDPSGRGGSASFIGESKLMREVLFLAENKTKAVVYFTQGHGELNVSPVNPEKPVRPDRSANMLKALFEKNYVEVKPWTPELKDAKVPDDATAVIVADPRMTLSPEAVKALHAYMIATKPGGKQGKLIVMSSPFPNIDGKGCADTGLEGLMINFCITLDKGYLLTIPDRERRLNSMELVAAEYPTAIQNGNPIAAGLASRVAVFRECRPLLLRRAPEDGEPTMVAEPIILAETPNNISWVDTDPPVDPVGQFQIIARDPELVKKYRLSNQFVRVLGAVASENKQPRVVVFTTGSSFADGATSVAGPPRVDLIAASLDWLRDRPKLAVINKTYSNYNIPKSATLMKLFWLPVGLVLMAIAVTGLGVWAVRRR